MSRHHFLRPLLDASSVPTGWMLVNARTGAPLATSVETAFDSDARRRGLLGRSSLAPGAGLIIAPCNAVHTCFMRFPIDVIFAARDGAVVWLRAAVPAWRASWALRGFATIELPAGTIAATATAVGDPLTLRPPT